MVLATLKASSGKQANLFFKGGRCPGSCCLGSLLAAAAMAAMASDMVVKAGPFDLPAGGQTGTLAWAERQEILGLTGVSAAVRDRKNTHGKRHLTLSGPMCGMELAKQMAWQYIANSQRRQEEFNETPGSGNDWVATERNQKKKAAASSNNRQPMPMQAASSSSWQPMPMQAVSSGSWQPMPMQAVSNSWQPMHMQGMMQQAMMQACLQPMLHSMLQQQQQHAAMMQPAAMQPMFIRQGGINEVEQSEADEEEDVEVAAEIAAPELAAEIAAPQLAAPQIAAPKLAAPKLAAPKIAAPELAGPPPAPTTRSNLAVLASTSKSRGPAPSTIEIAAKIAAKAAPLQLRLAGLKRELMEIGLAQRDQRTAAEKVVGDRHRANCREVDEDEDEDAEEADDGPVPNTAILASRRNVDTTKKRKLVSMHLDPTVQYVNIMSVGWRQQGVQYTKSFEDLVEGKQGLVWRLKVRGFPEPDVVVDCRPLKRYDFDKAILKHTGHNAAIVHQTVDHRLFKPTMKAALRNIREVYENGNGATVLVVCTSGCHRSVAMSLVLEYILQRQLYHTTVRHCSEGSWWPRRLCTSCTECDENNEAKLKCFEMAARMMEE